MACGPRRGVGRHAAAGLGRVPVRPELGEDPDRRAPPVGGLREGAASGWAETRRWAARGGGAGPRGMRSGLRERETDGPPGEEKEREKCWAGLGF